MKINTYALFVVAAACVMLASCQPFAYGGAGKFVVHDNGDYSANAVTTGIGGH